MYRQIDANDRVDTQDVEAQNTRAANPEANEKTGLRHGVNSRRETTERS